jgi:two-component system chemotaxis response regulator CheY
MRVLVVEDEPVSSKVLCTMLSRYGDVSSVENGKEAINQFLEALDNDEPFDLVLLDIMMPEVNGQEALAEIRAIESERGISSKSACRVIMTTALDDPQNLYLAHASGCNDYLVKPIRRESLMKLLNRMGFCLSDA